MKYKHYTDEQIDYIREIAKGRTRQDITDLFNEKFNQNRTVKGIANILHRHKIRTGMQGYNTQFKKGNGAWNKGLKQEDYLTEEQIDKLKHTQFKKGHVSPRRKELGSERINEFGFIAGKEHCRIGNILRHTHLRRVGQQRAGPAKAEIIGFRHHEGDVRENAAGGDGVAADALLQVHVGRVPGGGHQGCLGGAVGHARGLVDGAHRGDIDDISLNYSLDTR